MKEVKGRGAFQYQNGAFLLEDNPRLRQIAAQSYCEHRRNEAGSGCRKSRVESYPMPPYWHQTE